MCMSSEPIMLASQPHIGVDFGNTGLNILSKPDVRCGAIRYCANSLYPSTRLHSKLARWHTNTMR